MHDLIVIGGGLVGSAVAWGAARRGAAVAVLDEGDLAFRASRGNFGLVWVQTKGIGFPPYAAWSRHSALMWPDLAASLGRQVGIDVALRQPGGLMFCLSDAEYAAREAQNHRLHNEAGDLGTRMVDRAELRRMVPAVGDGVVGASFCPADGHANPLLLLRALHAALRGMGASYCPGITVDRIEHGADGFVVQAGAERVAGSRLVLAAGLGNAALAPLVGLSMPVRPQRGQIVVTERLPRFLDYATHVARQTEEGSVMLGDSQEEVGFDNGTTVPVLQGIASRALATFPRLRDAAVVRMWGALRVMTPDGRPIYQQSRSHPGAFAVTCHSGVTLAAAHALDLAPAILAGALPERFDVFSADRFLPHAA